MKYAHTMAVCAALAAIGTVFSGCPAPAPNPNPQTYTDAVQDSASLNPGAVFIVNNRNGSIRIIQGAAGEVSIAAEKKVQVFSGNPDPQALLDAMEVDVSGDGNAREIDTLYPNAPVGASVSMSVAYVIQVPRDTDLEVFLTNGDIEVVDIHGGHDVEVVNGEVVVEYQEAPGAEALYAAATNGEVDLLLPANSAFDLDAFVNIGEIAVDFPVTVESVGLLSEEAVGPVNGGGADMILRVSNGSIEVEATPVT